jgi:uncharacterized protein (DUF1697 family)
MARNNASGPGTRHVNHRYNYCREVHGSLIELIFVRSEENEADILTKNPTKEEHEKHVKKWVSKVPNELLKHRFKAEVDEVEEEVWSYKNKK